MITFYFCVSFSPAYGHSANYLQLLGNIRRNGTGHVVGASALLSLYMVHIDFLSVNFNEVGNEAGTADWVYKLFYMGPCHHDIVCLQGTDRGDGLQIWNAAVNILNKELQTVDREWSSSLGVGQGANNSSL
jgi:hypothetical protein